MIPLEIVKRPQAERDIEECFVFIGEGNIDAAIEFLVAVEDSLERLASFPLLGKVFEGREYRSQQYRIWPVVRFETYQLFYLASDEKIELARVIHSSRDIDSIFDLGLHV